MKSETFRCPHCKTELRKSDADQVLGKAGRFVLFENDTKTCPACGGTIDRMSIIEGKYDTRCFIATVAYGNADCLQVQKLRVFRDHFLATSIIGRTLMRLYYCIGPVVASHLARRPKGLRIVKFVLDRVVGYLPT